MSQLEADMEHAFAVAKSKDKTCGICMEVIMEKPKTEAR
jgi:E3 ubiquitin-protein ligase makorin